MGRDDEMPMTLDFNCSPIFDKIFMILLIMCHQNEFVHKLGNMEQCTKNRSNMGIYLYKSILHTNGTEDSANPVVMGITGISHSQFSNEDDIERHVLRALTIQNSLSTMCGKSSMHFHGGESMLNSELKRGIRG